MFGQPAPLSVNCVKTADALCLIGVITQRQTITGTKLKMWTLQKIPSASGRCFAQKMLKDATAITATQVSRVPCQRSGVYVASLITISACTRPPTMNESTAIIESQEIVASHPGKFQLPNRLVSAAATYRRSSSVDAEQIEVRTQTPSGCKSNQHGIPDCDDLCCFV
jgi:hypothetical protein